MKRNPPAPGQPPEGFRGEGLRRRKTASGRPARDPAAPAAEATPPPRTENRANNAPIVSVHALLSLAHWLDGWKSRNPEAWAQIQQRRGDTGEPAGDGVPPQNDPPREAELPADEPSPRGAGTASRRRTRPRGRGSPG